MRSTAGRLIVWAAVVALILAIPLALTLLGSGVDGDGWHWTFFDFVFMGALLFGACLVYELVAETRNNGAYRTAVGLAVATAVLLVWINAAVGIIGDGDLDSPNGLYFAVLAIGFVSACIARFRPRGMARALGITALAQALVPVIALVFWKPLLFEPPGVFGVFVLNTFFVLVWIGSALLFRRAGTAELNGQAK
ncbi:MAG: hypothetical protein WDN10_00090 [bacterium]